MPRVPNGFWTYDRRVQVFARLASRFGYHEAWGKKSVPAGRETEYQAALKELAAGLSALSGQEVAASALKNQVDWAITTQKEIRHRSSWKNWIGNKAAALEAGLISVAEMPTGFTVLRHDEPQGDEEMPIGE